MKAIKAEYGHIINEGDIIVVDNFLGRRQFIVSRVTKKYAFVRHNEKSEGKYPRTYNWGFCIVPRPKWNTTQYEVYIPVND